MSERYLIHENEISAISSIIAKEELYAKYGLSDEEISFIESMIKPMELGDNNDV